MAGQVVLKADQDMLNHMRGECLKRGTSLQKEFQKWMERQIREWDIESFKMLKMYLPQEDRE